MASLSKPVEDLNISDLATTPVWEYAIDEEESHDETWVRLVMVLPMDCLDGRLIGTQVRLNNGMMKRWAVLGNVDLKTPRSTQQFLMLWLENDGRWFELAR